MTPVVSHRIPQNEHLTSIVWYFTDGETTILKTVLINNDWIQYLSKPF